jgi:hypothetical protein
LEVETTDECRSQGEEFQIDPNLEAGNLCRLKERFCDAELTHLDSCRTFRGGRRDGSIDRSSLSESLPRLCEAQTGLLGSTALHQQDSELV